MAEKPTAITTLAVPKADPKAKGVGPLSARAKSVPLPKFHAAPAKASPPTAGRDAIAKAKPLMARPIADPNANVAQSSNWQRP
eukprot:16400854-Heterocapsa_arctica.AAC.1